jgi:RNA polymerase sigma-70 factor (ECF subfamily)
MHPPIPLKSDQVILSMISENNLDAWVFLYDKYAAAMFGTICKITEDKKIAEEIFKEAFLQLKEKQILSKLKYSLYPWLLMYTLIFAQKHLRDRGIISSTTAFEKTSTINILHAGQVSLD